MTRPASSTTTWNTWRRDKAAERANNAHRGPERSWQDLSGQKTVSTLRGLPAEESLPGVSVESMDPDHVIFRLDEGVYLSIGDQLVLIPSQQDAPVSRWDRFVGVRDGKVEVVWDIQARGCYS